MALGFAFLALLGVPLVGIAFGGFPLYSLWIALGVLCFIALWEWAYRAADQMSRELAARTTAAPRPATPVPPAPAPPPLDALSKNRLRSIETARSSLLAIPSDDLQRQIGAWFNDVQPYLYEWHTEAYGKVRRAGSTLPRDVPDHVQRIRDGETVDEERRASRDRIAKMLAEAASKISAGGYRS